MFGSDNIMPRRLAESAAALSPYAVRVKEFGVWLLEWLWYLVAWFGGKSFGDHGLLPYRYSPRVNKKRLVAPWELVLLTVGATYGVSGLISGQHSWWRGLWLCVAVVLAVVIGRRSTRARRTAGRLLINAGLAVCFFFGFQRHQEGWRHAYGWRSEGVAPCLFVPMEAAIALVSIVVAIPAVQVSFLEWDHLFSRILILLLRLSPAVAFVLLVAHRQHRRLRIAAEQRERVLSSRIPGFRNSLMPADTPSSDG